MPAPALSPLPCAQRIVEELGPQAARFHVEVVAECASTNDAVRALPGATDGVVRVLLAHRQHAGRGRRGRSWLSAPGQGLTFSCAWPLPPDTALPSGLPLSTSLAIIETLEAFGLEHAALKWPNDVLLHGRKLAGTLIEVAGRPPHGRFLVIGIGLNLLETAEHPLPDSAAALFSHLANPPAPETLLAALLPRLDHRLSEHLRHGFAPLRPDWQRRDAFAGRPVRILGDDGEQSGICSGLADDGALLLQTDSGTLRILSGDVSLRAAA